MNLNKNAYRTLALISKKAAQHGLPLHLVVGEVTITLTENGIECSVEINDSEGSNEIIPSKLIKFTWDEIKDFNPR